MRTHTDYKHLLKCTEPHRLLHLRRLYRSSSRKMVISWEYRGCNEIYDGDIMYTIYIYITGIITGYNLLLVSGLDKQSMGIVKSLGMTSWNNKNILSGDQMSYGVQVKYKTHGLQLICFFLGLFNIKKIDPYKVVYPVISWFRTSRDY